MKGYPPGKQTAPNALIDSTDPWVRNDPWGGSASPISPDVVRAAVVSTPDRSRWRNHNVAGRRESFYTPSVQSSSVSAPTSLPTSPVTDIGTADQFDAWSSYVATHATRSPTQPPAHKQPRISEFNASAPEFIPPVADRSALEPTATGVDLGARFRLQLEQLLLPMDEPPAPAQPTQNAGPELFKMDSGGSGSLKPSGVTIEDGEAATAKQSKPQKMKFWIEVDGILESASGNFCLVKDGKR